MKKTFSNIIPPLILFVLITTILETLSHFGIIPNYLLPPPSEIWISLNNDFKEYALATQETLMAAIFGLILAGIVGFLIAVGFTYSTWLQRALYPYATFFQTVPIVSIAPLLVIWFGFGLRTVVISSFIVSIFPIIANSFAGLNSTDKSLLEIFNFYGASKQAVLFKLRLPNAIPQILTGFKVSAGLAMIGAIIGEFIAGGGLGGIIDSARTQQRLDKVFAAILLTSISGLLILLVLELLFKLFLKKWRTS